MVVGEDTGGRAASATFGLREEVIEMLDGVTKLSGNGADACDQPLRAKSQRPHGEAIAVTVRTELVSCAAGLQSKSLDRRPNIHQGTHLLECRPLL